MYDLCDLCYEDSQARAIIGTAGTVGLVYSPRMDLHCAGGKARSECPERTRRILQILTVNPRAPIRFSESSNIFFRCSSPLRVERCQMVSILGRFRTSASGSSSRKKSCPSTADNKRNRRRGSRNGAD
jgi:hypothetical protein